MVTHSCAHAKSIALRADSTLLSNALQRACGCGNHAPGGECDECKHKREAGVLRAAANAPTANEAPPAVHDALRSPGKPLDAQTRAFMEPRFGHDFSRVRVHTDDKAAESAQAVNALAYTVGRDVVFGAGQYAPHSQAGRGLMAHELTHVVQQRGAHAKSHDSTLRIDDPTSSAEREAASVARSHVLDGPFAQSTNVEPRQLQRQRAGGGGAAPAPAVPVYRDCTAAITGQPNANDRLEAARQRARDFVGAAIRVLGTAPTAGTVYATALQRHFIMGVPVGPLDVALNAVQRAALVATYQNIQNVLVPSNFICNTGRICDRTEQAFWIPQDDLLHICPRFWNASLNQNCRAIILIHEAAHDVGIDAAPGAHTPNRGSANYPAGNNAAPAGQSTLNRMGTPDAHAFFAAHIWRNTDTGLTCF